MKNSYATALKFLSPLIEESKGERTRTRLARKTGKYMPSSVRGADPTTLQNDFISRFLEIVEDEERTAPALALRILSINMAASKSETMIEFI